MHNVVVFAKLRARKFASNGVGRQVVLEHETCLLSGKSVPRERPQRSAMASHGDIISYIKGCDTLFATQAGMMAQALIDDTMKSMLASVLAQIDGMKSLSPVRSTAMSYAPGVVA